MRSHVEVQEMLYDLVNESLDERSRAAVMEHLRACPECSAELHEIESLLASLPRPPRSPAEDRPREYWQTLPLRIAARVGEAHAPKPRLIDEVLDAFEALFVSSWKPVTVVALAVAAFIFVQTGAPPPQAPARAAATVDSSGTTATSLRMAHYLQQSKALLVGLANKKTHDRGFVDLSVEREMSRVLVHEARSLQEVSLDAPSARIVNDLERILLEVSNKENWSERSDFDMIRSGIQRENLLFKVRMAEQLYQDGRFHMVSRRRNDE